VRVATVGRATGVSAHQVLNRASWAPLAVSRQLLLLIVQAFVPAGACVDLVIDETLERCWGSKISKRGHYRDNALSSRERPVSSPGLRWIVMAVVVTVPWTRATLGSAFSVCAGYDSRRVSERLAKRHKTIAMWAHQMMRLLRRWLPDRPIKLMGDTAYTVLELGLHAQAQRVALITTGRLDAVLHEPPPQRTQHTIGRPRLVGQRLPALDQALQDPQTHWQQLTLEWYGEGEQTLEICTGTALCYRYGSDPLPIRWVLTRDPLGKRPPKAIFSTASTQTAEQIISHFMKRWSWEVTFEESRALMAHRDAAPMVRPGHRTHDTFALWPFQPCGTRMARALHPDGHISVAQAAW
jgi:DDE superfamily endonuclease